MAKNSDSEKDSTSNPLDLSQLKDLSFGPDWASEKGKRRSEESYREHDGSDRPTRSGRRQGGGSRDRRGNMNRRREGGDRRDDYSNRPPRPQFEPTVDVIFVSQDKPFEVLLKAMRTTHKTYELFEIARIVLGKENRFIAIISAKDDAEDKKLYISVPDQLPFETREEAINHVMTNHLERWFSIEEIEVDPPSGNFQMVNRCKLTGELLAPPNFHRYQEILKEHYSKNIHNLPWERFLEKIESVKEPEVVQEWLDKMKKTYRYTLKQKEGDESPKVVLNALEDVRYYLTTERKNEVFVAKEKIRLPGEKIESLPRGNLRRSIEREIESQRRFPLVTSNHLRGRLRRCNLNFFKKGSKGVTYVCAVKRKPRYKDTVFSESIQELIDYVEKHPKILVEDLVKEYKPKGVTEVTDDGAKAVLQDLRWLVGAGYVTEYANGALVAEKQLPINAAEDKNNQPEPPKQKPAKATTEPVAEPKEAQSESETEAKPAEAAEVDAADPEKSEAEETKAESTDEPTEEAAPAEEAEADADAEAETVSEAVKEPEPEVVKSEAVVEASATANEEEKEPEQEVVEAESKEEAGPTQKEAPKATEATAEESETTPEDPEKK